MFPILPQQTRVGLRTLCIDATLRGHATMLHGEARHLLLLAAAQYRVAAWNYVQSTLSAGDAAFAAAHRTAHRGYAVEQRNRERRAAAR